MTTSLFRYVFQSLTVVITTFAASSARADVPAPWKVLMSGGSAGVDIAQAAQMDAAGNLYVTGNFSGESKFADKSLTASGSTDIFLAKYTGGALQWIIQSGGAAEDDVSDMALDSHGNIYVTGWIQATATFRSATGEPKILENNGGSHSIFIAKYDPNGTLLWLQSGSASTGMNRGHGIAVDPESGNCYVTGMAQTATAFTSSSGGVSTVPGPWTWHMFLVKYDTNGNFIWGQSNSASPNSIARKVALDKDQNAYVTGWFESNASFTGADGAVQTIRGFSGPVQSPPYLDDAFLVKYNSSGHLNWINHIGGYKAIGVDAAVNPRGLVTITGFIGNLNDGNPLHAATVLTSQNGQNINLGGGAYTSPYNYDAFVATYDLDGNILDARRIGGTQAENGTSVAYDQAGDLYLAGAFQSGLVINDQVISAQGASNLFVLKYSDITDSPLKAGKQIVWIKTAANAGTVTNPETGYARLSITPGGDLLVAGAFTGTAMFDGAPLSSAGLEDAYVANIAANTGTNGAEDGETENNPSDSANQSDAASQEHSLFQPLLDWLDNIL